MIPTLSCLLLALAIVGGITLVFVLYGWWVSWMLKIFSEKSVTLYILGCLAPVLLPLVYIVALKLCEAQ